MRVVGGLSGRETSRRTARSRSDSQNLNQNGEDLRWIALDCYEGDLASSGAPRLHGLQRGLDWHAGNLEGPVLHPVRQLRDAGSHRLGQTHWKCGGSSQLCGPERLGSDCCVVVAECARDPGGGWPHAGRLCTQPLGEQR